MLLHLRKRKRRLVFHSDPIFKLPNLLFFQDHYLYLILVHYHERPK